MPKLLILSGIPFSFREEFSISLKAHYTIISRDVCREFLFGPHYDLSPLEEKEVDRDFNFRLGKAYLSNLDIIHNNTNSTEAHIDRIIAECPVHYDIEVKFFHVSLWRALIYNYARYLMRGRWIPFSILKKLKKGFDSIDKGKYKHYSSNFAITQKHW